MKTFGTDFTTEKNKLTDARPFLTVVFHFAGGDIWLCERSLPDDYVPGATIEPIIQGFGQIGTALTRDFDIVDVGDTEITFVNLRTLVTTAYAGRRFSDLWDGDFETIDVDLYLNYLRDDDSVVREPLQSYIAAAPTTADEELGRVLLTSRFEKWAQRSVLKVARREDYINVREEDANKPFALPLGECVAIPTLRLGDVVTAGQQIHTVCESPAENPVESIDEVYWNGVKLTNQNIVIEADTGSNIYPIELRGSGPMGGGQHGYRQRNNLSLTSGGSSIRVGADTNHSVKQPFVVPRNLINPRIVAVLVKVATTVASSPPTPLMLQLLDSLGSSDYIGDPDDGGALDNPGDALGTANLDSATLPTTGSDAGGTGIFHFSGVAVSPGQTIYAMFLQTAGSLVDYYHLSLEGEVAPGFLDYLNYSNAPVPGDSITMIVYYAIDGYKQILPADMTAGEVSTATRGIIAPFGVTSGVAAIGIEVKVARVYDREGSVDVSLQDVLGNKLAALTIHGDELDDPTIPFTNWQDYRKYFDEVILIEPATYFLAIDGGFMTEGSGGIVFQGANFLTGSGALDVPSRGMVLFHPSGKYQPESTDAEPIALVFKLLTMDWTEYVTGLTHSGFAELLFHPKTGAAAASQLPPIPEDVTISAKVTAEKSQPDEVFHALLTRMGVDDSDIDLAVTFAAAATHYLAEGDRFDGAVTTQQTFKELFARLAFESLSVFDWQWDKAQLKWLPRLDDEPTSVLTFDRSMIRHKGDDENNPTMQLAVSRTPDSRIVNIIDAFYAFNPAAGGFSKKRHYSSAPSVAVFGEKERPGLFKFLYVADDAMLERSCLYWLARLAFKKRIIDFQGFLRSIGVEKDDPIDVDTAIVLPGSGFGEGGFGEDGYGGASAFAGLAAGKLYVIQAINYDWTREPRALLINAEEL